MANNELTVDEPRLGWFVDGNPNTEEVAVMLRDTGAAIELSVPLRALHRPNDPYGRWFSQGVHFGDDPDRTKYSYAPPSSVMFQDAGGRVVLVGCRSVGSWTNFSRGVGRLHADLAVLGGSTLRYDKIHGLRSEVPALADWTGLGGMDVDDGPRAREEGQVFTVELPGSPELRLTRKLNLSIRPVWRSQQSRRCFTVWQSVQLQTRLTRPRPWRDHLNTHRDVLDLASLAAWSPFGFGRIAVHRSDDPERSLDGAPRGDRWAPVRTHGIPLHADERSSPTFLFTFMEVGTRGVAKWLKMCTDLQGAIDPLRGVLRSEHPWSFGNALQSGIALEALGFQIDSMGGGARRNSRGQVAYKAALEAVVDGMRVHPIDDPSGWVERSREVHTALKHPDKPDPDLLEVMNSLRENLLVLRFWVAQQIGVPGSLLVKRLPRDTLAQPITIDG